MVTSGGGIGISYNPVLSFNLAICPHVTYHINQFLHVSCVENLVGIYSNHMVFRQNLSPLFREPSLFFRGDEFYKNLFRELSRRTVPFEEEIFTI